MHTYIHAYSVTHARVHTACRLTFLRSSWCWGLIYQIEKFSGWDLLSENSNSTFILPNSITMRSMREVLGGFIFRNRGPWLKVHRSQCLTSMTKHDSAGRSSSCILYKFGQNTYFLWLKHLKNWAYCTYIYICVLCVLCVCICVLHTKTCVRTLEALANTTPWQCREHTTMMGSKEYFLSP